MNNKINNSNFNNIFQAFEQIEQHLASKKNGKSDQKINSLATESLEFLRKHFKEKTFSSEERKELVRIREKISSLYQKTDNEALQNLNEIISQILTKGQFSTNFSLKDSVIEITPVLSKTFISRIKRKLTRAITGMFFHHWKNKIEHEKNVIKIIKVESKLSKLESQLQNLKVLKATATGDEKLVEKYDESISKVEHGITQLKRKLSHLNNNTKKFLTEKTAGEKTRFDFATIGGEPLTLTTPTGVKLDGMYLSASAFRNKLIETGIEQFNIESENLPAGFPSNGLIYDQSKTEDAKVLDSLNSLRLFGGSADKPGAGWIKIQLEGTSKILIVEESSIKDYLIINELPINAQGIYHLPQNILKEGALKTSSIDANANPNPGTILLGSGSRAAYEMTKREVLAFLIRGNNVMMINYRGYGNSEGIPSQEGTYEDIETAYQYLKNIHHVDDQKIIAKGLCLSGGVMAELARRHPDINLFLDQTYAEFNDIVKNQIENNLNSRLNLDKNALKGILVKVITGILNLIIKQISPTYTTLKALETINGKVFLLESRQDLDTPQYEQLQMLKQLKKFNRLQLVKIASIPGKHAASWLDALELQEKSGNIVAKADNKRLIARKFTGRAQIDHFLQSLNMLHPIIAK